MSSYPEMSYSVKEVAEVPSEVVVALKVKRAYKKRAVVGPLKRSKRLQNEPLPVKLDPIVPKKNRGRPRKNAPALSV